jgi:hypothetical protein
VTPPRAPETARFVSHLETVTGLEVRVNDTPKDVTVPLTVPHLVVWSLPSNEIYAAMLGDGHYGHTFSWDVWAVGSRADQCEMAMDKVVTAVVGMTDGAFDHPWPSGEPSQRRYLGTGPGGQTENRSLVWSNGEFQVVILG